MQMLRPLLLLSLASVGFGSPQLQDGPVVMLTHYSDAQCPCSARVPWDYKHKFLDNEDFNGLVDFQQFFVGDLTKNPHKCIHGEGECVAQRHFACAQHMATQHKLSYRDSTKWLDFEVCSYGECTDCAAILGPHCPCRTYSNFNDYEHNDVMKNCSAQVGLEWTELHECAINGTGEALMVISAERSNSDNITYGVDGLAPIYVDGVKVHTKEPIPVVCGPVPRETHTKVCQVLETHGLTPPACKA